MKSANSAGKQTRWRQTLQRMLEQAVRCGWCSCGCLLARYAQHRPFNIRLRSSQRTAPFVARSIAERCSAGTFRAASIANRLYGPSDGPCQSSLAAGNFNCSCKCVHGPMIHVGNEKSTRGIGGTTIWSTVTI